MALWDAWKRSEGAEHDRLFENLTDRLSGVIAKIGINEHNDHIRRATIVWKPDENGRQMVFVWYLRHLNHPDPAVFEGAYLIGCEAYLRDIEAAGLANLTVAVSSFIGNDKLYAARKRIAEETGIMPAGRKPAPEQHRTMARKLYAKDLNLSEITRRLNAAGFRNCEGRHKYIVWESTHSVLAALTWLVYRRGG